MTDIFPKDKKKIVERIRRYENSLLAEKRRFGSYDDGYGKRYLLGPLYLLAGDIEGAVKHYKWFEMNFDDDCGEPIHRLCWVLTLYRKGDIENARRALIKVMLINLYIIPYIIGNEQEKINGWYGSNWEWKEYLEEIPQEIWALWKPEEITWVRELYFSEQIITIRNRYITIHRQMETEPVGKRRSELIQEASKFRNVEEQ